MSRKEALSSLIVQCEDFLEWHYVVLSLYSAVKSLQHEAKYYTFLTNISWKCFSLSLSLTVWRLNMLFELPFMQKFLSAAGCLQPMCDKWDEMHKFAWQSAVCASPAVTAASPVAGNDSRQVAKALLACWDAAEDQDVDYVKLEIAGVHKRATGRARLLSPLYCPLLWSVSVLCPRSALECSLFSVYIL